MQGDLVRVRATKKFGTSQQPWFDSAIVQFDASDDPENEVLQLGYVKTCILFEVLGTHYMFVRWLTSAQLGSSITNRGNEFESHHIRNLPRLKWNMRTQTRNKSYQVMPVSLLRKGAWVHADFRDASILWHIKSTPFYMHQDPEQAMGTVAGGNKKFTLINQSQFAFECSNTQMQKRIVVCVSKIASCGKKNRYVHGDTLRF